MIFLSILDAINMSAENFALKGNSNYLSHSVLDATYFDMSQISTLSKTIINCLKESFLGNFTCKWFHNSLGVFYHIYYFF